MDTTGVINPYRETWTCPRKCGYYRTYPIPPSKKTEQIIDHPAWGRVTNAEAAANDIYYHSCKMYRDALARMKTRQDFAKMIREDERASLHRMQEPGV